MIAYLIKSVLCLLVLWAFYKVALEPLAAHRLKRFYLLGSLVVSLTLPLLTITYEVKVAPQPVEQSVAYFAPSDDSGNPLLVKEKMDSLSYVLGSIYMLGVLFFGFRFARNIYRIDSKIRYSEKRRCTDHTKVLLDQKVVPHSFLRFIFLPKSDFLSRKIAPEILEHERAHVIQKHSWDILTIELLQVLFWFNPLLFWFKKSIALNHEFLADQQALRQKANPFLYTQLLLQYSGGAHHTALSSPINYSLTRPPYNRAKKRILMLSKTFSAKKLATRLTFLLPVLALCIYFFNQDIVAKPVVQEHEKNSTKTKFEGKWKSTSQDLIFDVQDSNGGITWDIIKDGNAPIRYWPKLSKNGVYFTQGTEDVYYIIQDDILKDSKGNTFQKFENAAKHLRIYVSDPKIDINGNAATIKNFAQTINNITADWSKEDMMNYSLQFWTNNGVDKFVSQLTTEFRKTQLYKTNPSRELIPPPPPPAPKPPKVGELPPPPPPAPQTATAIENLNLITIEIDKNKNVYFNGQPIETNAIGERLESDYNQFSKEQRKSTIAVRIKVDGDTPMGTITDVKSPFYDFGIRKVSVSTVESGNKNALIEATENRNIPPPPPPPFQNSGKIISIRASGDTITFEGIRTDLQNFADTLDKFTQNWNEKKYRENAFGVMLYHSSNIDLDKLKEEMKKTDYFKKTGRSFLPPPPPAPRPPKIGEVAPPPPAPAPPKSLRDDQRDDQSWSRLLL